MSEIVTEVHKSAMSAHERTLERIRFIRERGFPDWVSEPVETAIVVEICARVIGVKLPTPRLPAPNGVMAETGPYEYDLTVPNEMRACVGLLENVCRFEITRNLARGASDWVRKEYFENPNYAYKYPVQPATESAPTLDA